MPTALDASEPIRRSARHQNGETERIQGRTRAQEVSASYISSYRYYRVVQRTLASLSPIVAIIALSAWSIRERFAAYTVVPSRDHQRIYMTY
jgi:hypothetical protein